MGQPAARVGDMTSHGTPLGPGPGCPTVLIGGQPAWRAGATTTRARSSTARSRTSAVSSRSAACTVMIGGLPAARQGDMVVEPARRTRSRSARRR